MEYLECFERFPNAYAKIVESLNRIETLYEFLESSDLLNGVSSLLSIGSGDGAVEARLARKYDLALSFVEPAEGYFEKCLAGANDKKVEVWEAHQGSFESFTPNKKYDLVLSLYSWFAFEFNRDVLEKALSCRSSGGKLVICLQGEASPSTLISGLSQASGINLTSEKISEWADKLGYSHRVVTYHGTVPSATYLSSEGLTQTGRDLVSFLLATPWEDITEELKSRTLQILREGEQNGVIDFESPCLIFE